MSPKASRRFLPAKLTILAIASALSGGSAVAAGFGMGAAPNAEIPIETVQYYPFPPGYGPPPLPPRYIPGPPIFYGPPPGYYWESPYSPRPRFYDELIPAGEVIAILREHGYKQIQRPKRAGRTYVVAALNAKGAPVNVTVHAYTGRILKVVAVTPKAVPPPVAKPAPGAVPVPPPAAATPPPAIAPPPAAAPVAPAAVPVDPAPAQPLPAPTDAPQPAQPAPAAVPVAPPPAAVDPRTVPPAPTDTPAPAPTRAVEPAPSVAPPVNQPRVILPNPVQPQPTDPAAVPGSPLRPIAPQQ